MIDSLKRIIDLLKKRIEDKEDTNSLRGRCCCRVNHAALSNRIINNANTNNIAIISLLRQ